MGNSIKLSAKEVVPSGVMLVLRAKSATRKVILPGIAIKTQNVKFVIRRVILLASASRIHSITTMVNIGTTVGYHLSCQICRKKGHTAENCFYRVDIPPNHISNSVIICQIYGLKGHAALDCHHRSNYAFQGAEPPSTLAAMTVHNINGASSSSVSITAQGFPYVGTSSPRPSFSPDQSQVILPLCSALDNSLDTHIGVSPAVVDGGDQNVINNDQADAQLVECDSSAELLNQKLKIGVVLSGGHAPGGHNVISGIFNYLQDHAKGSTMYGFRGGPAGFMKCKYVELTPEYVYPYRNQGGFDMICSGRDKIETPEQFKQAHETAVKLDLDGLVVIGGDDSNGVILIPEGLIDFIPEVQGLIAELNEILPHDVVDGDGLWKKKLTSQSLQLFDLPCEQFDPRRSPIYENFMLTKAKCLSIKKKTFQDFCALIHRTSVDTSRTGTQNFFMLLESECNGMICYFIMFLLLSILQLLSILHMVLRRGYTSSVVTCQYTLLQSQFG
ncbi:putative diphosphate--fructose-6-phosphate 1-phosphotransferase [Rosa chinensis]|uniref:Putative diphosphate--fructose-6-phosphate 1-phosphotransferase n=1 Tax=Rosa chinensis TaxID=74649 RepID=A0A2P6SD17_ROSCH|nr:putative diphosphate--fructose-6-phosphate 1-phosphotransferase [Rosa chinensis]